MLETGLCISGGSSRVGSSSPGGHQSHAGSKLPVKPQRMLRSSEALRLPHAVEDMTVGEHSQHDVVRGGIVNEGPFGMHKEDIGDPDLLYQPAVKGHALVGGAGK